MGTNYYLYKKSTYTPIKDRDKMWWEDYNFNFYNQEYNKVQELVNGYVYFDKYYPTIEELNKEYYLGYHIGKNSSGWRFLLSTFPEFNITSLEDWKKLFNDKDNKIFDEYGEKISKEEMLKMITKKEPSKGLEGQTSTTMDNETYEVRDGLIVHPLKYGVVDNSAKETYDICERDFS